MSNFVSNKVICEKTFFDKYFLDFDSLGTESYESCKEQVYISFNKLFGVKDVNEYFEKYGAHVWYSLFYSVTKIDDELVEVKFYTR